MWYRILSLCCLNACLLLPLVAEEKPGVDPIAAELLAEVVSVDADLQRSLLAGVIQGMSGMRSGVAPAVWSTLATKLQASELASVRIYAWHLAGLYGDKQAAAALRTVLKDNTLDLKERRRALKALLHIHPENLHVDLLQLLSDDAMRSLALRAVHEYDHEAIALTLINGYSSWSVAEQRDALHALSCRVSTAHALLAAVETDKIPLVHLTASVIRQLSILSDARVNDFIAKRTTGVAPDSLAEVERLKSVLTTAVIATGDAKRGKVLFESTCAQCHMLFGGTGNLGPDLTGLNRPDLDWILKNVLDPSAIMGGGQELVVARMKDNRVIAGMQREDTNGYYSLQNESGLFVLLKNEIASYEPTKGSTMPNGLFRSWNTQQLADFLSYFQRSAQLADE